MKKLFISLVLVFVMNVGLLSQQNVNAVVGDQFDIPGADGVVVPYVVDEVIPNNVNFTITNANAGTGNKVFEIAGNSDKIITVSATTPVTIVFNNAKRSTLSNSGVTGRSPLQLIVGANVTVVLADGTTNEFICNGTSGTNGVYQAGISVPVQTTLTIKADSGILRAEAGAYGAGIGGGPDLGSGNIIIEGGDIFATTRTVGSSVGNNNGAGIGGGGGNVDPILPNEGIIKIFGNAKVTAISQGNGAGIGGGASNTNTSGSADKIEISGTATVSAISKGNGAGIGGGASVSNLAGSGGEITILGNANVTATSEGAGTGIGGGASTSPTAGANRVAGSSGKIIIGEDAVVNAIAKGDGTGIGGGYSVVGNAGRVDEINIKGNAIVNATSEGLGTGIGGGYSTTGTGGAGGKISIEENPTIVVSTTNTGSSFADIGRGINNAGLDGALGEVIIIGGNVYADNPVPAKNTSTLGSDALGRVLIITRDSANNPIPNHTFTYAAEGDIATYDYVATSNASGETYIWIPKDNQLVMCLENGTNLPIESKVVKVKVSTSTKIKIPEIDDYLPIPGQTEEIVYWDTHNPLTGPIEYFYEKNMTTLTLEAYNSQTGNPIRDNSNNPITYTTGEISINKAYNFKNDILVLNNKVDLEHINKFDLAPLGTTFFKTETTGNIVKIFYLPKQNNIMPIECYQDSVNGLKLAEFGLNAAYGQTITLTKDNMLDLSHFGFKAEPAKSTLKATVGDATNNKIIFIYTDTKFVTKVSNNINSDIIEERTIAGDEITLTPPYIQGYKAVDYSVNGGAKKAIPANYKGHKVSKTTDIKYFYEAEKTADPAKLTIVCVDDSGNQLWSQSLTSVVDSVEVINAPQQNNYVLKKGQPTKQKIKIAPGQNIVTFVYVEKVQEEEPCIIEDKKENRTPDTGSNELAIAITSMLVMVFGLTIAKATKRLN